MLAEASLLTCGEHWCASLDCIATILEIIIITVLFRSLQNCILSTEFNWLLQVSTPIIGGLSNVVVICTNAEIDAVGYTCIHEFASPLAWCGVLPWFLHFVRLTKTSICCLLSQDHTKDNNVNTPTCADADLSTGGLAEKARLLKCPWTHGLSKKETCRSANSILLKWYKCISQGQLCMSTYLHKSHNACCPQAQIKALVLSSSDFGVWC